MLALSFSHLGNSTVLVQLMEKVGRQYSKSRRHKEFVFDLLQLNTPKLFQHTTQPSAESDTDTPANRFTAYLKDYVRVYGLKGYLLKNYCRMMVSTLLKMFHIYADAVHIIVLSLLSYIGEYPIRAAFLLDINYFCHSGGMQLPA